MVTIDNLGYSSTVLVSLFESVGFKSRFFIFHAPQCKRQGFDVYTILLFQYCLDSFNVSTIACSKHKKVVTKTYPFIIPFSFERLRSFVKAIIFKWFFMTLKIEVQLGER